MTRTHLQGGCLLQAAALLLMQKLALQLISASGYTMLIDRQQMAVLIHWMIRKEESSMNYIVMDLEWNQSGTRYRAERNGVRLAGEIIEIGKHIGKLSDF